MKRNFLILLFSSTVLANNPSSLSLGINFMLGGRYDNLRMCVATPAGVKGGPIADIMLNSRVHLNPNADLGFTLPIMRPVLFALAFKMLQFEPQFIFEYKFSIKDNLNFILGPGLGASLHWGPDYKTERKDENRQDFFAAGPFISNLFGIQFKNNPGLNRIVGIRIFYTPLFSKNRSTGTVLGTAMEAHLDLVNKR